MRRRSNTRQGASALGIVSGLVGGLLLVGCAGTGSGGNLQYLWSPFQGSNSANTGTQGPGSTGTVPGGGTAGGGALVVPCRETQARKFVRISMRNLSPDFVHYFLVMIAFVYDPATPDADGAVCADDIALYTAAGYVLVRSGSSVELGDYCITGPALYYFHKNGQFQGAGTTGLASAIGPALGSTPTYDTFFTSASAQMPVPNAILFHNPGTTTAGQALKISRNIPSPCSTGVQSAGDPYCRQDAFYYVDETDRLAGSTALGSGSGRRVPGDIEGTGCECLGTSNAFQLLAPSNLQAKDTTVQCDMFFRGGRIDYVFVRDDTDPPYPQLLWRVTDASGTRAHDFDPRAKIP